MEKLKNEREFIAGFALAGLKRLSQNKFVFSKSAAVTRELNKYLDAANPYMLFIKNQLKYGDNEMVAKTWVYNRFRDWAKEEGLDRLYNVSRQEFYSKLVAALKSESLYFGERKIHGGTRYFIGFKLVRDNGYGYEESNYQKYNSDDYDGNDYDENEDDSEENDYEDNDNLGKWVNEWLTVHIRTPSTPSKAISR